MRTIVNSKTIKLRKHLELQHVKAVIDTREQLPLNLSPMPSMIGTLKTGDYSLMGLTNQVAIEKKFLQDLITCCGRERERFMSEIDRLRGYQSAALVVIGSEDSIRLKQYRGDMHPNAIIASLRSWQFNRRIPFFWCKSEAEAAEVVRECLYLAARSYWHHLFPFMESISADSISDVLPDPGQTGSVVVPFGVEKSNSAG